MVKKQLKSSSASKSNTITEFFKMGFGIGLGVMLVQIIFTAIALIFFITGFVLLKREQAKEKKGEKARTGMKVLAYILMVIGAIFAIFLIIPLLGQLGGEDFGDF
jgi:NADH:ubiquinone oxidoreductase subunit 5 (subunit L)/multisubunit Na+/H+ antiporter MnhA subunit